MGGMLVNQIATRSFFEERIKHIDAIEFVSPPRGKPSIKVLPLRLTFFILRISISASAAMSKTDPTSKIYEFIVTDTRKPYFFLHHLLSYTVLGKSFELTMTSYILQGNEGEGSLLIYNRNPLVS
jgi:hypothetical protein